MSRACPVRRGVTARCILNGAGQGERDNLAQTRFRWWEGIKTASATWSLAVELGGEERQIFLQARLVFERPAVRQASRLAASRPQVSFNCVSNWLLPVQLLSVSHSIFHRSRKSARGTFPSEGRHSHCHICASLMWFARRLVFNWSPAWATGGVWR